MDQPTSTEQKNASPNAVVLILDDSPVQANIFRKLINGIDADFLILETYKDAAEAFSHQHIDIVITDYNLDDAKTGVDLIHHANRSGQFPRCFFMTTESPVKIRAELGNLEHAGFLVKPINIKKFRRFMEKQLAAAGIPPND